MAVYHFEGVPRGPVAVAIKNILTLGIHTKLWLYRINREMDGHEGFHIDLRWLGVMVALPIVTPIIVKFQTARRLNQMVSHQVTQPIIRANRLGWISIVPVVGAGFYAWWVQTTLNRHWFHHRREERISLAEDRIARLKEAEATETTVEKRRALEEDVRRMRREIDEEIEAARLRWGEERFADRMRRAELHAAQGGRMSRKDLQRLREEEKAHRKAEKARRKATRGRLFGLLPAKADADEDAWQPRTAAPERTPEEIRAVIEQEAREPTKEEEKEIAAAAKALAKIEKERTAHEKAAQKARARREKQQARLEAAAEKKRLKQEKADAKKVKAKAKPKTGKKEGQKKGKGAPPTPDRIAVQARRVRAPDTIIEVGAGPLRLMTIACPRCRTRIENVQKRGDAPAKVTCPTCGLVGKV